MKKNQATIVIASLLTLVVLILGCVLLGILPAFLFAFGFMGGSILWPVIRSQVPFVSIKVPYFKTPGFFIGGKWERYRFFLALSEITGGECRRPIQ